MLPIENYLDSTYLKTPAQSGLSEEETFQKVLELTDEAIANHFILVMIRPDYVKRISQYIKEKNSDVLVGTVIGFHEGTYSTELKLSEAKKAIEDGVDELDYVLNYEAFKSGDIQKVKDEFVACTKLGLDNQKLVKWIIEIAALTDAQIAEVTKSIVEWTAESFQGQENQIFIKSSTGFYQTEGGKPNGATPEGIKIMLENAGKHPVKAAGGVRTHQEALDMIAMGVQRIGTSSAKALAGKSDEEGKAGY